MKKININKDKLSGHAIALFTITVWGSTYVVSKHMLSFFTPPQMMVMRFILAYAALWALRPKWSRPVWRDELGCFLMGLFGCTAYFLAENFALTFTLASNVSILVASAPIFTAVLAHFFTKDEKLRLNTVWGSLIAITGVALVVFNGTVMLKLNPVGDVLSVCAAACWAIYAVILKRYVDRYDSIVLSRKVVFYGLITTLPAALIENRPLRMEAFGTAGSWFCILFLGILASGVCYATWNVATKKLGVVVTNNYVYVGPFVTLVMARIFLNEKISWMAVIGAVLIVGGVVVCGITKKRLAAPVGKGENAESINERLK